MWAPCVETGPEPNPGPDAFRWRGAEEHAAGSKAMFDSMDTDKDGFVTLAELALGHQRMMRK